MKPNFPLVAIAAALLLPSVAQAHPKLLSAMPAAGATVAAPARVALKFSEPLIAQLSGGELMMTGRAGPRSATPGGGLSSSVGADRRTLVLTPATPLMAGRYRLDWHAVSTDTHRVTGSYAFTVR